MKYSTRLFQEIERVTDYLVTTNTPEEQVECYYEFCYKLLMKSKKFDESNNADLVDMMLEEALSDLHLALHHLVFGGH